MPPIFLLLLLVLSPFGRVAYGALGVHDVGGPEGACAACHNVAQTAATRGWGRSLAGVPTSGWYTQPITQLCWSCHVSGNTVGAHDVTAGAMNNSSHYYIIAQAPPGARDPATRDNAAVTASSLPYAMTGALQCTSCHNTHNDQYRPFLAKTSIQGLCNSCHPRRNTSALGTANIGVGGDDVSVHPVNLPMVDNAANGPSGIKTVAQMDGSLKNNGTAPPASNGWFLGGKLSGFNAGNISCETCHAVHGVQSAVSGAIAVGMLDLAAIENQPEDSAAGSNPLCEGCHFGGRASGSVGGAGTADHPLDNVLGKPYYPTGVAIPVEWKSVPAGGTRLDRGASVFTTASPASGTQPVTRCSSCHDAHGGVGGTSLLRSPVPAAASGEWCFSCHTASQAAPTAHHSARGLEGGRFVSSVNCVDCHGGTAGGGFVGHNGFFASYATPPGNFTTGRNVSVTVSDVQTNHDSALCLYCHRDDNPVAWRAVTLSTGNYTENGVMAPYVTPSQTTYPRLYGTKRGGDSHSLATDANAFPGAILKVDTWVAGRSVYSKYGVTTGGGGAVPPTGVTASSTVICESCHNILVNDGVINPGSYSGFTSPELGWASNLLLLPYKDDPPGTGSGAAGTEGGVRSELCLGCHTEPSPSHHPLTGETVYRTGLPLANGSGSLANQTSAPIGGGPAPGTLSYPASNAMDCDSCHRPHSAATESAVTGAAGRTDGRYHYILEVDGAGNNWSSTLCLECHPH